MKAFFIGLSVLIAVGCSRSDFAGKKVGIIAPIPTAASDDAKPEVPAIIVDSPLQTEPTPPEGGDPTQIVSEGPLVSVTVVPTIVPAIPTVVANPIPSVTATPTVTPSTPMPSSTKTPEEMCRQRNLLMLDLQPAGSSQAYETMLRSTAEAVRAAGFNATHKNRAAVPTLDLMLLQRFDIVFFGSGCGGVTGMLSTQELSAIKDFYLGGGNIAVITDDSVGDSSAPGSCFARVNPIANALGLNYSGLMDNSSHGCAYPVNVTHPVLQNVKLKRNTSALMTLTGQVSWGQDAPSFLGWLSNGQPAEAFIEATSNHGAALFSPDFGSLVACQGVQYVQNLISHLGCKR